MNAPTTSLPLPFSLHRDPWGRLVLELADGRRIVGATAARMFPVSSPDGPIALCDGTGHEITWIKQLDDAQPAIRELIEDELSRRDFIPVIRRIVAVSSLSEPCEWHVETDRGPTKFILKSEEDVHRIGPHRAIIIDARGLRFLLDNAEKLDAPSRRFAEWWGI
ncbi:MAG: DUF1854 domain-containing protein [Planctomycetota bacterium]